jgi:2,4-dienoyl-CoA reductase-like NADH-dependent reductase (Old Yellow Enzyme family)
MSLADSRLFQPWTHGSLSLRNRVVMAPMTRRKAAEDGIATAAIAAYYRRRAEGEVGLIISEGTAIDDRHAYDTLTVPRIETEAQLQAWKRVVDQVHAAGGAFAPQLWHTGRLAANPIGPSAGPGPERADGTRRPDTREMTDEDIAQVLDAFDHAAAGSRRIGCDALEIHGAHGYLLDSFLSPVNNRREDAWGGSFEKRMRFPLEVLRRVRTAVGPDFPVIYRFSQWQMDDYRELKFREPAQLRDWVLALRAMGVDILHVSTRAATDAAFPEDPEHPEWSLATWARHFSGLPTIAVGKVSVTQGMDEAYGETPDPTADPAPRSRWWTGARSSFWRGDARSSRTRTR